MLNMNDVVEEFENKVEEFVNVGNAPKEELNP